MIVIPQEVWEAVQATLNEVRSLLTKKTLEEADNQWIESVRARKMLGVSAKTWQTYRDERRIPFSQFGRKIYVKRRDLEAFMNAHYIKARDY